MQQIRSFADERLMAWCVYCGGHPMTRDHVPPKILLDEPYPENLPVVASCLSCNQMSSVDEEYVAVLLDAVLAGTTDAEVVSREKVRRIMKRKVSLALRLQSARVETAAGIAFQVEVDRVHRLVLKLARGHAAYELAEPQFVDPVSCEFAPLFLLNPQDREAFEAPPRFELFPEVGSRAMQRMFQQDGLGFPWVVVQPGRYRYLAAGGDGLVVRMVLGEYLGCEVVWG